MPRKSGDLEVPPSYSVPGMKAASMEFKAIEDEQEKALRLHKERITFYFKDIGTYTFGICFLLAVAIYCFWALFDKTTPVEERRYVWAAISAILGGIVGIFFGRSTK